MRLVPIIYYGTYLLVIKLSGNKETKQYRFRAFYSMPEPVTALPTVIHAVNFVHKINQKVNPGQIPVITGVSQYMRLETAPVDVSN